MLRKVTNYQIEKESHTSMNEARRFNPALIIRFRDKKGIHAHTIDAGYSDDIFVYRDGPYTYVLSLNERHEYAGLQVFNGSDEIGDIFIKDGNVEETIGHIRYAPYMIIKKLRAYIIHNI